MNLGLCSNRQDYLRIVLALHARLRAYAQETTFTSRSSEAAPQAPPYIPRSCALAICKGLSAQKRDEKTRTIKTLPMSNERLSSQSLLCCEASGGYTTDSVTVGGFCLDNIQVEVDGDGKHAGKFRMSRPAGTTKPPGDWPLHWSDMIHEFDGQCQAKTGPARRFFLTNSARSTCSTGLRLQATTWRMA